MELRVWVEGVQRVVCGVKLNTTCEQIVVALAHATKQSGRFTMVERWRNNERLLSPNEQPLVTLQRWGDCMSEVEFILRKTTTTLHTSSPTPNYQNHQRYNEEASILAHQNRQSLHPQPVQTTAQQFQQQHVQHQLVQQQLHPQRLPNIGNPNTHQQTMNIQQLQPLMRPSQNTFQHQQHQLHTQRQHHPNEVDFMLRKVTSTLQTPSPVSNYQNRSRFSEDQQTPQLALHPHRQSLPLLLNQTVLQKQRIPNLTSNLNAKQPITTNSQMQPLLRYPNNSYQQRHIQAQQQSHSTSNSSENISYINEILSGNQDTSSVAVNMIGQNMLKLIEEQKKLLINQKNELERLDTDSEFMNNYQEAENSELINKIEEEIIQLEQLSKDNQIQIKRLEEQDFQEELVKLKKEQMQIEIDIDKQKSKLVEFEKDIVACYKKIQNLEKELTYLKEDFGAENLEDLVQGNLETQRENNINHDRLLDITEEFASKINSTDTSSQSDNSTTNTKSCDDIDSDDESCNDASDDCGTQSTDSKPRSPKLVDKRGLINGIRSLKIDRHMRKYEKKEAIDLDKSNLGLLTDALLVLNKERDEEPKVNNQTSNGFHQRSEDQTATNSRYEFLMNL